MSANLHTKSYAMTQQIKEDSGGTRNSERNSRTVTRGSIEPHWPGRLVGKRETAGRRSPGSCLRVTQGLPLREAFPRARPAVVNRDSKDQLRASMLRALGVQTCTSRLPKPSGLRLSDIRIDGTTPAQSC